jgi:predicted secreted acid phosphatase
VVAGEEKRRTSRRPRHHKSVIAQRAHGWVFDIDETLLSNLAYYVQHG